MLFRFLSQADLADHLTNFCVTPRATDAKDFTRGYRQALKDAGALVRVADLPEPQTSEQQFLALANKFQVASVSIQRDMARTLYIVILANGWTFNTGPANGKNSFTFASPEHAIADTTRHTRCAEPVDALVAALEDATRCAEPVDARDVAMIKAGIEAAAKLHDDHADRLAESARRYRANTGEPDGPRIHAAEDHRENAKAIRAINAEAVLKAMEEVRDGI